MFLSLFLCLYTECLKLRNNKKKKAPFHFRLNKARHLCLYSASFKYFFLSSVKVVNVSFHSSFSKWRIHIPQRNIFNIPSPGAVKVFSIWAPLPRTVSPPRRKTSLCCKSLYSGGQIWTHCRFIQMNLIEGASFVIAKGDEKGKGFAHEWRWKVQ